MDWLFNPVFGVPLIIWLYLIPSLGYSAVFLIPSLFWAQVYDRFLWNEDYMAEVLGEELVAPHRKPRPR